MEIRERAEADQTPENMWYLAGLKMARARKLLTDTSYAIGEIAILCGFPDANYFTRFFHRHEGIPPANTARGI